jgi:Flp pilus assembly protein TadD
MREGVKRDAKSAFLRFQLGVILEKKGDWDGAEKQLEEVIRLQPTHAEALNYLGYSWVDRGLHLDKALKLIRKAVKLQPENPYFLDSLGWAYFKKGDSKKAETQLRKAAKLLGTSSGTEDSVVFEHLGQVYKKMGRKKDAQKQFDKALAMKPQGDAGLVPKELKSVTTTPQAKP